MIKLLPFVQWRARPTVVSRRDTVVDAPRSWCYISSLLIVHDLWDALDAWVGEDIELVAAGAGELRDDRALVARLEPVQRVRRDSVLLARIDRKSTRLNSSHANISYAVFCLKKK